MSTFADVTVSIDRANSFTHVVVQSPFASLFQEDNDIDLLGIFEYYEGWSLLSRSEAALFSERILKRFGKIDLNKNREDFMRRYPGATYISLDENYGLRLEGNAELAIENRKRFGWLLAKNNSKKAD